jgi:hypothetical protein
MTVMGSNLGWQAALALYVNANFWQLSWSERERGSRVFRAAAQASRG